MKNDHLQGILFTHQPKLDLGPTSRRQRIAKNLQYLPSQLKQLKAKKVKAKQEASERSLFANLNDTEVTDLFMRLGIESHEE